MQNRYSLVISPSEEIIAFVKKMKDDLAKEIGWFNSKNSLAHITINEFMATESEMELIKQQLFQICDCLSPKSVCLDSFATFPNGAFFIAPNENSKKELKEIMKYVNQSFRPKTIFKNSEPHLSIARRLNPEKIAAAYHLFSEEIQLNFICDNIALRLFNPKIKQFEIIDRFHFNSNSKPSFEQGTLF